ncbi:hypothetical protein L3X38_042380 [Prunus dulcis]|uniref:Uncharacterized protein n=1 Tax=Prunus dulcis TaxID=3755 RepID=A0AAD4YL59_PRUDU|nr:hypothetical protein L3X38_042380 [Prunus dulcis]
MVPKAEEKLLEQVCYEMPTKKMSSQFKPLYVGAHFDGFPVRKVLVDTGAIVNILLASFMRKLKKGSNELILTETTVSGFVGDTTTSKGIIALQVRVGQNDRIMSFFAVETMAHFNALLGRDWIHRSMCEPFSLHQFLQFWHEDGNIEIVQADAQPFMAFANAVETKFYENDIGLLYFIGRAAKHGSTANWVEFIHEDLEDNALEFEEVELASSANLHQWPNEARTLGQDGKAFKRVQGLLYSGLHQDALIEL